MPHHHVHADYGHAHTPGHSHAPANFDLAFALGIGLNIAFVLAEVVYGFSSGSLALLADAGHNLADVLGLAAAWSAVWLSRRPATATFTYGYRRSSIMASLINAVFVLVSVGMIAWEGVSVAFALDCCREAIGHVATTGGITDEDVQDLMVAPSSIATAP